MGCGQSKLEPDDEAAVAVAAGAAGKRLPSSGRKVFGDIRRRRNAEREFLKGSFIRPDQESDAGDETDQPGKKGAPGDKPALSPTRLPQPDDVKKLDKEESSKNQKKKKKAEKKDKKMERVAAAEEEKKAEKPAAKGKEEEEEHTGSPSFRFYFDESVPRWMENELGSADATKNDKGDHQGKRCIHDQNLPAEFPRTMHAKM